MTEPTTTAINWFQQKIVEAYGNPQTKKVPLPPKIEWEEINVPYEDLEEYTEHTDAGPKRWVFFVAGAPVMAGIALIIAELIIAGVGLLFGGVVFFAVGKNKFRVQKEIVRTRKVAKTRKEKRKKEIPQFKEEIVPGEWAIKKMGTGALKMGVAKTGNTKFLTGIGFFKSLQKFNYPVISKEKSFMEEYHQLESELASTPFVLNGEKEHFKTPDDDNQEFEVALCGLEKDIMNHFIETEYLFSNSKNREIKATLLQEDRLHSFLVKNGQAFQLYDDEFLSAVNDGFELEDNCRSWQQNWPGWNSVLENSRYQSVNEQVIPEFTQFSNLSHYSSFNFYCPTCNKEVAEDLMQRDYSVHNNEDLEPRRFSKNTRCHFLLESNAWQCPMCERITLTPIPLHKSLDEVLLPVYDNLMEENKTEREKDYSDVRKKEIHYKNEMKKELETMYFDNLNSILELKDNMEKMHAEIEGETDAIQFINQSITKYKKLQSDIINSIENANEAMKMQIQATAQKILADVDRVKDREMELLNRELTELSKAKRLDDERRDSVQRQILSASQEQNQILNSKFDELISTNQQGFSHVNSSIKSLEDTNKQGFANVTSSVQSLEKTNKEGFQQVAGGISKLEQTNRKGFENQLKSSKDIEKAVQTNNAMQAARNKSMGINPYDDNPVFHPFRAVKRGLISVGGTLTGKSSMEMDKQKLKTVSK